MDVLTGRHLIGLVARSIRAEGVGVQRNIEYRTSNIEGGALRRREGAGG